MGIKQAIANLFGFTAEQHEEDLTNNNVRQVLNRARSANKSSAKESNRKVVLGVWLPVTEKLNRDSMAHYQPIVRAIFDATSVESMRLYDHGLTPSAWKADRLYSPTTPAPWLKLRTYLQVDAAGERKLEAAFTKAREFLRDKATMVKSSKEGNTKEARGRAAAAIDRRVGINGEDPGEFYTRHVFLRLVVRASIVPFTIKTDGVSKKAIRLVVDQIVDGVELAHPHNEMLTEDWLDLAVTSTEEFHEGMIQAAAAEAASQSANSAAGANEDM
jgi:hypothetical protein